MTENKYPEFCNDGTPGFAYARTKALRYLEVGPELYRKDDFFDKPSEDWGPDTLKIVKSGCQQMAECNGYTADRPLVGLGVEGVYRLIELFHFRRTRVNSSFDNDYALDKMTLEHTVTGNELILYNRIKMDYFDDDEPLPPGLLD
jgi:hypothetical protein